MRQLVHDRSARTVRRIINRWLAISPPPPVLIAVEYALFDCTFVAGRSSAVGAFMSADHGECRIVAGSYGFKENSVPNLRAHFRAYRERGLSPRSVTVDGNPHVIAVLRELWPYAVIQRCLVHVQRQGLMWCRQKPKTTAGRQLRKLFLRSVAIHSYKERDDFLSEVEVWERRFGHSIASAKETGWVMSDLKRARSMLYHAIPDMFHYLDDENIPNTANALEGYFSRMKRHYTNHRGLAVQKRPSYFAWYLKLHTK